MVPLDKGLQWVNLKQKQLRQILGTFRHNQTYPEIIQAYLEPCLTLTYSKLWYIQNPNILRTRSLFRTPVYSEPCYIQNTGAYSNSEAYSEPWCLIIFTARIVFANYNYFCRDCRVGINMLR